MILGVYDLMSEDQSNLQVKSIEKVVIHPKFANKTFNNDIAIVKLDTPIEFSYAIRPICLPQFRTFPTAIHIHDPLRSLYCYNYKFIIMQCYVDGMDREELHGSNGHCDRVGSRQRNQQHFSVAEAGPRAHILQSRLSKDQIWRQRNYR